MSVKSVANCLLGKGTFKKYVRSRFPSFDPPPPFLLVRPCSFLSTPYRHPTPPFPPKVRSYLLKSHSGISINWTPLVHGKSVRFIESPSKNQKSSKVNMNSTICHDFPNPDLLEEPKDGKI